MRLPPDDYSVIATAFASGLLCIVEPILANLGSGYQVTLGLSQLITPIDPPPSWMHKTFGSLFRETMCIAYGEHQCRTLSQFLSIRSLTFSSRNSITAVSARTRCVRSCYRIYLMRVELTTKGVYYVETCESTMVVIKYQLKYIESSRRRSTVAGIPADSGNHC